MRLVICETLDELGIRVAKEVAQLIKYKPNCVLGLPTGDTPVSAYKELVKIYKNGNSDFSQVVTFNLDEYLGISKTHPRSYHSFMQHNLFEHIKNGIIDFSRIVTFNLDEYLGISKSHPCSYHSFMQHNLFGHINIPITNIHIPDGLAESPDEECRRYENLISKYGGIDLLILGIGQNGHIGFNEPGTPFDTLTHVADLTLSTIQANSRFFDVSGDVPKRAITMGIKTILSARRIILMVSGHVKSQIVYDAFTKEVTLDIPASALQAHSDVTLMLDKNAARLFDK